MSYVDLRCVSLIGVLLIVFSCFVSMFLVMRCLGWCCALMSGVWVVNRPALPLAYLLVFPVVTLYFLDFKVQCNHMHNKRVGFLDL